MPFLNTILDAIFPIRCLSCKMDGVDLCVECISEFPAAERENAKWIFSLFDYRHPGVKKAIWLLKYKGKKRLAGIFAEILHGRIMEELADLSVMENFREPLIIPIPLSRMWRWKRGYNQAELICKKLMDMEKNNPEKNFTMGENILIKPKDTK